MISVNQYLTEISSQKRWELEQEYKDEVRVNRQRKKMSTSSWLYMEKVYLNLPYSKKDEFKDKYRIFWDKDRKKWYINLDTRRLILVPKDLYDIIDFKSEITSFNALEKIKLQK